jgi:NO-binding membrane sensor protein with MHYT domain/nitrogen-specific signal transduction histidine kinase
MNHALGLHGAHDPLLVGLSLIIAVMASYTALTIARRLRSAERSGRLFWLGGAAVALGGGIWSMHFVAMLAFSLGVPIDYDIGLTVSSLIAAVAVTGAAFYVVAHWHGSWKSLLIAGTFAGVGVATMHYMGMAAMRMNAAISYDPTLFAVSIVIAVVAATAALWLAFNLDSAWHKVAAAFVIGAAIGGMHRHGGDDLHAAGRRTDDRRLGHLALRSPLRHRRRQHRHFRPRHRRRAGRSPLHRAAAARAGRAAAVEAGLRDVNRNLQAALEKLSTTERLATIGQIAATAGHELRNPLASIRNSMELPRKQTSGKELGVERALDRIDRNTDRCANIISDLLNFARKKELVCEPTPITSWLAEMLDEHPLPAGIVLDRNLRAADDIPIDRQKLRQVIVNLVATEAMIAPDCQAPADRPSRIVVRTESRGAGVQLSVADSGPGIAADVLPRIFEPLFTTKSFGIGLGMPMVKQIVELHQGTIAVDSDVGMGTTIHVWLPRQHASVADAPAASEMAA